MVTVDGDRMPASSTAKASSTSRMPMSALSRPVSDTSDSSAEAMPCGRFAPDGLVKTRSPCARTMSEIMCVVVDLPFDPSTKTTPFGNCFVTCCRKSGTSFRTMKPG
jgi:hypothetical protein